MAAAKRATAKNAESAKRIGIRNIFIVRRFQYSVFSVQFAVGLGGGFEGGGGRVVHVIKVDFLDETDGQLVVDEENMVGGVHAGAEVLTHPPETQVAKDCDGRIGRWTGLEGREHLGPDNVVTIQG